MLNEAEIHWLLKDKYGGVKSPEFEFDVKRIESGEPIAYVIGWVSFLGCHIDLSKKPLIPRPETEYWTEKAIQAIVGEQRKREEAPTNLSAWQRGRPVEVLDIFAGSGCIGIAILKFDPSSHLTFADIDPKMLEQTKINLDKNEIHPTRYKLIQSNIFSNIIETFDFIVANPPYISESDKSVQESVKIYEPSQALWSGNDGLEHIEEFLKRAYKHLKPKGKIYLEFGHNQKTKIEKILNNTDFESWEFLNDQFEQDRYVIITD